MMNLNNTMSLETTATGSENLVEFGDSVINQIQGESVKKNTYTLSVEAFISNRTFVSDEFTYNSLKEAQDAFFQWQEDALLNNLECRCDGLSLMLFENDIEIEFFAAGYGDPFIPEQEDC